MRIQSSFFSVSARPLRGTVSLALGLCAMMALQGCLAGKATKVAVAATSLASSAVGTATGAASSAVSSVGTAAAGAVAAGAGGTGGGAGAVTRGAGDIGSNPNFSEAQGVEGAAQNTAGNQVIVETPQQAFGDAFSQCMNNLQLGNILLANASTITATYHSEPVKVAQLTGTAGPTEGVQTLLPGAATELANNSPTPASPLLFSSINPGRSCVMTSNHIAVTNAKSMVFAGLDETYPGAFRIGRPDGATGFCDGFTLNLLNGNQVWLRFTDGTPDGSCRSARDQLHMLVSTVEVPT